MADVSIATCNTSTARGMRSVVFTTPLIGYWFLIDSGGAFRYNKTTDGGATWGGAVAVAITATCIAFDVWYDQWTPGDSGTLIHIWWFDSTNDVVQWRSLNTSSDTLGTTRGAFTGASAVAGVNAYVSGTKARSGYLYVAAAIDSSDEEYVGRSTDSGTTWSAAATMTALQETNPDHMLLFPSSNSGDDNDLWMVYFDSSATALTMKFWDNSASSFSESSTIQTISAAGTDLTWQMPFSGAIRHSDGHLILVSFSERDTATADMQVWDINNTNSSGWSGGSTGITTLTNITTNKDDIYYPAVFIDQNTDDIYVAYNGSQSAISAEVLGTTTKIYYEKSTDGGTTWNTIDTAYQEGAASANFQTWAPISGPRFYVGWRVGTTLVGNAVNSVDVSGAAPIERTTTDAFNASDSATRQVTLFRSDTESIIFGDVAIRLATLLRSASDSETISESAASTKSKDRSASDAVSESDVATRQVASNRSASDAETFAQAATRVLSLFRSITDAGSFIDAATAVKTGGASLFRTVADAFTGSDSAARIVQNSRSASDAGTFADAPARVVQLSRSTSDAATAAQIATRTVAATRSATDASTWADIATQSITSAATIFRTAADAFTSSDIATRTAILFRAAADTSTYAQVATRGVARLRTATDAFSVAQVATRLRGVGRNLVDVFTVSDSAARLRALLRDVVNATTFSDLATAIKNLEAEMKVFAGQIAGTFVHSTVALGSTKIQVTGGTLKIERTE
jgi:hypothetical protein